MAADTHNAFYNGSEGVKKLSEEMEENSAAIIVAPGAGNMGCIPPEPGFLEGLRELCDTHQALLIFDEVMTGFRIARGGAQERFGVEADLVTYGKIIGA